MEANRIKCGEPFWIDTPSGKQKIKIKIEIIKLIEYTTQKINNTECPVPVIFVDLLNNNNLQLVHSSLLEDILFNEKFKIIKPTWKPEKNDYYFIIDEKGKAYQKMWCNDINDISYFLSRNCFKSELEAKINKDTILKLFEKEIPLVDLDEM